MRPKLTYANVLSTLCFFLLLSGGAAFAASQLGKSSVGPKQLKKNAVTTAKIKNEAVTAAKIKKGTLTGAQVNVSTLGTVPHAQTADVAQTANGLAASEEWHLANLINGWVNVGAPPPFVGDGPAAYYKDRTGLVHLRGSVYNEGGNVSQSIVFNLPPGYRPGRGMYVEMAVPCNGSECPGGVGVIEIGGTFGAQSDGYVRTSARFKESVSLDGITFRAES